MLHVSGDCSRGPARMGTGTRRVRPHMRAGEPRSGSVNVLCASTGPFVVIRKGNQLFKCAYTLAQTCFRRGCRPEHPLSASGPGALNGSRLRFEGRFFRRVISLPDLPRPENCKGLRNLGFSFKIIRSFLCDRHHRPNHDETLIFRAYGDAPHRRRSARGSRGARAHMENQPRSARIGG